MSTATPYVCKQFVEDVTAYLEGALGDDVVARVDAHLADCPHCREYLREMRLTIVAAGTIGKEEVEAMPADLRNRLLDAFREPDA
jgi:anti-sigma factor RsiW